MSFASMVDLDAADERELRRETARAQVRSGTQAPPATEPVPAPLEERDEIHSYAPSPARPIPSPASMPPRADGPTAPTPPPFRVVGDVLPSPRGKGFEAPPVRLQAIALAIEHPGQWIEYRSNPGDPFKNASTLAAQARDARGGFRKGFTARVISGVAYIRYQAPTAEEQHP